MNIDNFRGRDLKDVIKIICDQNFFNELVDLPNIIMKNNTYCYKGIPIFIDNNLKYKTCELVYKGNDNFYDDIVNNLKQEAKHLNDKISIFRSKHDIQNCIVALKALRETLDLIKKYDWNLMYSEYGVENTNNQLVTEIAVWEQNHDGQIRNHKVWRTDVEYKKYKYIVDNEIRP